MAVVPRKRKRSTTYYVATKWQGKLYWEPAGHERREAERLDRARKKEIELGTYQPPRARQRQHVGEYLDDRLRHRKGRNAANEASQVRAYVLDPPERGWFTRMRLEDVRVPDILRLIAELRACESVAAAREGKRQTISEKSVQNIYGVVRSIFREALTYELIAVDPFAALPKKTFRRRAGKKRGAYSREDVARLLAVKPTPENEVKPGDVMFVAIALFSGMREGEVCGRRWRDIDWNTEPLPLLRVHSQYEDKVLKTEDEHGEQPRNVPIHPALERILRAWWREGFERAFMRRAPTLDDFIVPRRLDKKTGASLNHTRSSAYKAWRRVCDAAGVVNLSLHSTRHTFITFAIRDSHGRKDLVEKITHNASGDVVDGYTHTEWEPLCEVVTALRLGTEEDSPDGEDENAEFDARPNRHAEDGGGAGNRTPRGSRTLRNRPDKTGSPARAEGPADPPDSPAFEGVDAPFAAHQTGVVAHGPRLRKALRRAVDHVVAGDEEKALGEMHRVGRLAPDLFEGVTYPTKRARRAGGSR